MIHPLKNNSLNKTFNELENKATDPVDMDQSFSKCNVIYNDVLDMCKHTDDATAASIITFINDLKTKYEN
jgi:hypothetical protein